MTPRGRVVTIGPFPDTRYGEETLGTIDNFDLQADPEQLTLDEARRQAEALAEELRTHLHLYHVESRPEISDEEYDRLFRRLQGREDGLVAHGFAVVHGAASSEERSPRLALGSSTSKDQGRHEGRGTGRSEPRARELEAPRRRTH